MVISSLTAMLDNHKRSGREERRRREGREGREDESKKLRTCHRKTGYYEKGEAQSDEKEEDSKDQGQERHCLIRSGQHTTRHVRFSNSRMGRKRRRRHDERHVKTKV